MGAIHMRAWPRSRRRTIALHLCGEQRVGTVSPRRRPDRRTTTARRRRRWRQVTRLLEHLLTEAEAGGRPGRVIEFLVLQALTHHAGGDTPGARSPLERVLGPGRTGTLRSGVRRSRTQGWRHCRRSGDLRTSGSAERGPRAPASRTARRPSRPGSPRPDRQVTTSITTCGDAGSPHRLLPFEHTNKWPGDSSG